MIIISHDVVRPPWPEALGLACYYATLELLCVRNAGPASGWMLWDCSGCSLVICAIVGGAQRIHTHITLGFEWRASRRKTMAATIVVQEYTVIRKC